MAKTTRTSATKKATGKTGASSSKRVVRKKAGKVAKKASASDKAPKRAATKKAAGSGSAKKATPKRAAAKGKGAASKRAAGAGARKSAAKKSSGRKSRSSKRGARMNGFALRLVEHRDEILDLYRHDVGVGVGVDSNHDGEDDIDRANFDQDRDLALALSSGEREVLVQIEAALGRIEKGDYGNCTNCSQAIGEERLTAIPWARYCIDCQELEEKGLLE